MERSNSVATSDGKIKANLQSHSFVTGVEDDELNDDQKKAIDILNQLLHHTKDREQGIAKVIRDPSFATLVVQLHQQEQREVELNEKQPMSNLAHREQVIGNATNNQAAAFNVVEPAKRGQRGNCELF